MSSLVSIIIPSFNRASFLGETLDSVISQTYPEWECLVIDDGSTDHTPQLMEFYQAMDERISYHKRPKDRPKGANACRNYGFELSRGEFVNWFDDDDLMHPEKLELQVRVLVGSKWDFSVCKTSAFEGNKENVIGLRHDTQFSENTLFDYIRMRIGWMTPSALWKREFLSSLSYLFDEELKGAQEWEFHTRILTFSPSYIVLRRSLDLVRKHTSSITYNKNEKKRFWYYFKARLRIYRNRTLELDRDSKDYIESYLLNSFKRMIVKRNPFVMRAFRSYFWPSKRISPGVKVHALLAILSFRVLNKGNFFLQKIKYKPLTTSG